MKKILCSIILVVFISLVLVTKSLAQSEELSLTMSRDWGYGGFNNDIQGLFSMHVSGPENLDTVEFFIDDMKIGEDGEAPFVFQFSTDAYPLGSHSIHAIGHAEDSQILHSNIINANFVSASEGTNAALKMIGPILGVVLAAIALSVGIPALVTRGKKENLPLGEARHYGLRGGGICPKCHRPFALHFWGVNLGFSKLDRCPYCGKWSMVRAQTSSKLHDAEKAELEWSKADIRETTEEERLRKDIDDSRYQN